MKRFLAHVIIEAKTPLKVGGGKNDLFLDAPVQRDWNGLPMILGTTLARILRRAFEDSSDEIRQMKFLELDIKLKKIKVKAIKKTKAKI